MTTENEGPTERGPGRGAPRDSLFLLTLLTSPEGGYLGKARVRNLSATGLMADCRADLHKDQAVMMDLRGAGKVNGAIVWVKGDRIGVKFDRTIDPMLARKPVTADKGRSGTPDYLRSYQNIGRR